VIVLTGQDLNFVQQVSPQTPCVLIPNGVALSPSWVREGDSLPRIGFMGRLTTEKGLPVLLKAAAGAPHWQWLIAGDGPLRDLVSRTAQNLEQVSWMGWVEDAKTFLSQIDLLVQPSVKEGLPYSVLDAMACGIPVIATPVGGMGELLGQVDGALLFEVGNAADLLRAARYALEHRVALAVRMREILGQRYTLQQQLRDTESILMEAGQ
jgi:glycosyltransferase involved in cell wall biosynthesis